MGINGRSGIAKTYTCEREARSLELERSCIVKVFKCKACGETSYSSADLEHQKNPDCPHCGANMREAIVISAATKIIMACENMKISDPVKVVIRELFQADEDMCVICGSYVPEGRMVCPACEADPFHGLKERRNKGAYNKDGE